MKKINKNIGLFAFTSFLAFMLISSPLVSSAKDANQHSQDSNTHYNIEAKIETKAHIKTNHSIWSRIFHHFFSNDVKAEYKGEEEIKNTIAPKIASITAPTVLKADETGTWIVQASDVNEGSLNYSVDWGDNGFGIEHRVFSRPIFIQTNTFTHAYHQTGTYTIKFTVKNEAGLSATATTTVHITKNQTHVAPVILNLDGPKEVLVGEEVVVAVKAYDPNNASLTYSVDWGDDFAVKEMALLGHSMPTFVQTSTFNHMYIEPGTYTATFMVQNSAGKKTSAKMIITVTDKS